MAARFIAAYDSECECGNPIDAGDEAGYVDDEVACSDCCEEDEGKFEL